MIMKNYCVLFASCCRSPKRLALVSVAAEEVVVAGDILVAEVEEEGGVEGYAAKTCLKVQV